MCTRPAASVELQLVDGPFSELDGHLALRALAACRRAAGLGLQGRVRPALHLRQRGARSRGEPGVRPHRQHLCRVVRQTRRAGAWAALRCGVGDGRLQPARRRGRRGAAVACRRAPRWPMRCAKVAWPPGTTRGGLASACGACWRRRGDRLRDRDRVELYRPLLVDPKEARRLRQQKQRSRSNAEPAAHLAQFCAIMSRARLLSEARALSSITMRSPFSFICASRTPLSSVRNWACARVQLSALAAATRVSSLLSAFFLAPASCSVFLRLASSSGSTVLGARRRRARGRRRRGCDRARCACAWLRPDAAGCRLRARPAAAAGRCTGSAVLVAPLPLRRRRQRQVEPSRAAKHKQQSSEAWQFSRRMSMARSVAAAPAPSAQSGRCVAAKRGLVAASV